jgi:outer membrane receptor protein involved in Fe transport
MPAGRRASSEVARAVVRALRVAAVGLPMQLIDPAGAQAEPERAHSLTNAIPAQPLKSALAQFQQQTGLQLVYVTSVLRGQSSPGATAGSDARGALAQLLRDTGLTFEYLTPSTVRIVAERPARPAEQPPALELQEVLVTATRRTEAVQKVPMSVQVFTGESLAALNITTFDDLALHAPGLTAHGIGPAQNDIYMRGLATPGASGIQTAGARGTFSTVVVYLDEQSMQLPSRNADIYAADLARIEILRGPQGTLFGGGAQAGVIRYITNSPKLDVLELAADAGAGTTAHGAPSSNLSAVFNVPLVEGKLALRAVFYQELRGGYITNIPATFARTDSDASIRYAGYAVPANSVVLNNFNITGSDINPVTYKGLRASALYQFDEDWSALFTQSYQNMEADGVFAEMAANAFGQPLPALSVELFNPSYDKDRFSNSALTVEGRVGDLRVLYTGAYLVRNVDQTHDYTSYAHGGGYVDYYQCVNPGPTPAAASCFTPSSTWHEQERNTHQSHELRLRTPDAGRVRGVGGLFYETFAVEDQTDWFYLTATPYFHPLGPPTGYYTLNGSRFLPSGWLVPWSTPGAVFVPDPPTSINPGIRPPNDGFFNDITRTFAQKAAYASLDFELVPGTLTLTAGTRYNRFDTSMVGAFVGGFGCQLISYPTAPNPCVNHSNFGNLDSNNLQRTFSGFMSRANLTWQIADQALLYYTWSQGFRGGGVNRLPGTVSSPLTTGAQALAHGGWRPPVDVAPDTLTNNELGWKVRWENWRTQWNGALYREEWAHVQTAFNTAIISPNGFFVNGGDYRTYGLETALLVQPVNGMTIDAGASWNHSDLVRQATFLWRDGTPIDFDSLRTQSGLQLQNPSGALGSPLPGAPSFQATIHVRYDFNVGGYGTFLQAGAFHQSSSLASSGWGLDPQGNSLAYELAPFTQYDASGGFGKDGWLVEVYGENLTDARAQLFANYAQWYKAVTTSRPRTVGVRFSYKFSKVAW